MNKTTANSTAENVPAMLSQMRIVPQRNNLFLPVKNAPIKCVTGTVSHQHGADKKGAARPGGGRLPFYRRVGAWLIIRRLALFWGVRFCFKPIRA
jgi:hypothetical protein